MDTFAISIETNSPLPPTDDDADALMEELIDLGGTWTSSPSGTLELLITIPASDLRQAINLALAASEKLGAPLTVIAQTEAQRNAREGLTRWDEMLSTSEAAELIGITAQAVRAAINDGRLPARTIGARNSKAIPRAAAEQFAAARR